MSEPEKLAPGSDDAGDGNPGVRKPYTKPTFAREQLFETMALACGKVNATIAQCRLNKKNS